MWLETRLGSITCGTIMDELDNWRYDTAFYQTIRDISDSPHQVPHMIHKISSKPMTNYKKQLKISFILILVEFLPTSNSTQFTPTRCSEPHFSLTGGLKNVKIKEGDWCELTSYFRWKPTVVDFNRFCNYAVHILRPENTESGEPKLKNIGEKT